MTDELREATLELIKAEKAFLKITQQFINETIDETFIDVMTEKVDGGMDKADALRETVEEFGYTWKDDR